MAKAQTNTRGVRESVTSTSLDDSGVFAAISPRASRIEGVLPPVPAVIELRLPPQLPAAIFDHAVRKTLGTLDTAISNFLKSALHPMPPIALVRGKTYDPVSVTSLLAALQDAESQFDSWSQPREGTIFSLALREAAIAGAQLVKHKKIDFVRAFADDKVGEDQLEPLLHDLCDFQVQVRRIALQLDSQASALLTSLSDAGEAELPRKRPAVQ